MPRTSEQLGASCSSKAAAVKQAAHLHAGWLVAVSCSQQGETLIDLLNMLGKEKESLRLSEVDEEKAMCPGLTC